MNENPTEANKPKLTESYFRMIYFPVVALSGLWMWKGHAVRRLFPGLAILLSTSNTLVANPSFFGIEGTQLITAMSADGKIFAAESFPSVFRWDQVNGLTNIGHLDIPGYGPEQTTYVSGISGDGSVMVGSSSSFSGNSWSKTQAYLWTQQTGMQSLVDISVMESHAEGVSDDGRTVVGSISDETGQHAALWRDGQEVIRLEAGTTFSAVSRNGLWVAGTKAEANTALPFRWSLITGLLILGNGTENSYARAISDDGEIVVGQGNGGLPFRWTSGSGIEFLPPLTPGDQGTANALSADGKTVGGGFYNSGAFLWTETNGLRELKDLLQTNYGMDLSGWKLLSVGTISGDGLTIAGRGMKLRPFTQSGDPQGFAVRFPPHFTLTPEGDSIRLDFDGVLQSSPDLKVWTDIDPQPPSPYVLETLGGGLYFRTKSP